MNDYTDRLATLAVQYDLSRTQGVSGTTEQWIEACVDRAADIMAEAERRAKEREPAHHDYDSGPSICARCNVLLAENAALKCTITELRSINVKPGISLGYVDDLTKENAALKEKVRVLREAMLKLDMLYAGAMHPQYDPTHEARVIVHQALAATEPK
jgi:hypothetical protein